MNYYQIINLSEMPAGQLPVLEIDGKQYYQSKSIARFLAKRNNLAGSNDEEAFLADATVDTIDDFRLGEFDMVNNING